MVPHILNLFKTVAEENGGRGGIDPNEIEWGFYAQSASEVIFRVRAYSHNLFSLVIVIT